MTEFVSCADCVNLEYCINTNRIADSSEPICEDGFIPAKKEGDCNG